MVDLGWNQGFLAGNKVFCILFFVVFDVGDKEKEDWDGIRGFKKARPQLEGG